MKLLFVFTGGTIGSTEISKSIGLEHGKGYRLIEAYREKYSVDFSYDTVEPYTLLSENLTGEHIRSLVGCVLDGIREGYDGIVVTHGTDTLQYTSAAIGYCVPIDSIPVCIVSANRPIEHPHSNGLTNLHAAITFIIEGRGGGVFVPYLNDGEDITYIHRATRLMGGIPFSDRVESIKGGYYGYYGSDMVYRANETYLSI